MSTQTEPEVFSPKMSIYEYAIIVLFNLQRGSGFKWVSGVLFFRTVDAGWVPSTWVVMKLWPELTYTEVCA